jgi:hypothetical protein
MPQNKAQIRLRIYDGARRLFAERQSVLLRVHNGQTTNSFTKTLNTKSLAEGEVLLNVDFFDNFADNYTIVVSADGYRDTGFFPVKVSLDAVRYKDLGAHAILEVISSHITNSLTDPVQVYQLRWMAGKQAGLPEFEPPFVLVE